MIYGLITLGLIVLPTQVFQGTPLFCTPCLEVSRENAVLKICRSKKVLSTTSKETALFRKLCSTKCSYRLIHQEDQCGGNLTLTRSGPDPGYQAWYVKNYCTQHAISEFTQYFPYILLFLPVVLVGIERFFSRLFSANSQIEGLSALLRGDFKIDKKKKYMIYDLWLW